MVEPLILNLSDHSKFSSRNMILLLSACRCCGGIVMDNTQMRRDQMEENADHELKDLQRLMVNSMSRSVCLVLSCLVLSFSLSLSLSLSRSLSVSLTGLQFSSFVCLSVSVFFSVCLSLQHKRATKMLL